MSLEHIRVLIIQVSLMYPTKKREGAWTLREMGSTWEGGMGEGLPSRLGARYAVDQQQRRR
jgi:hypothetical protein